MRPQSVLTGFQALGQTVQRLPSTQGLPRGICCHAPGKCDRNVQSYFQEIFIKLQHKPQAYEAGHKTHNIIWQVARDHPLYIWTFCDPPTMSADFFCKIILNLQKKKSSPVVQIPSIPINVHLSFLIKFINLFQMSLLSSNMQNQQHHLLVYVPGFS